MYAKVAVEAALYHIDKPYTYRVPQGVEFRVGQRVAVPFGRGNRTSEGIILGFEKEEPDDVSKIKAIYHALDNEPLLNDEMLKIAAFMRDRNFCTFYDAIKTILPAGVWTKTTERIQLTDPDWRRKIKDSVSEMRFLEELENLGNEADTGTLERMLREDLGEILNCLKKRGIISSRRELESKTSDKMETIFRLAVSTEDAAAAIGKKLKKAPVQAEVLRMLAIMPGISGKELTYYTGANSATLKTLQTQGLIEKDTREVFRRAYKVSEPAKEEIELNAEQAYVYRNVLDDALNQRKGVSLLFGVTGSGKTAIYINLIKGVLEAGKSALLLVPEISLTPQLVSKLTAYFGTDIAVLHSALHIGERFDEWKRIREGKAHVIVGTRSAVFAPVNNLGIIILDEEHEHSYKSENNPRYHAREIAIYRGMRSNAPVLLGSATPSIESMYFARTGIYRLYRLLNRYNGKPVPAALIIDMKQELREGNDSTLSRMMKKRINQLNGHQAILFLNRRGAGKMVVCVDCGNVPDCPNCSAHLTYHKANGRLMCHYCNYSEPAEISCSACGGHRKVVGFGTQTVQTDVQELLKNGQVLRMDADTIDAVNTHEVLLSRFEKESIPVMVGTQMVAKGLDFPNVTLVGVIDADSGLYIDSYRAEETAFSTITQVIGRSGRGAEEGTALIQTMTPENPVITLAAKQDYIGFYEQEILRRNLRGLPPFRDLAIVLFSGIDEESVEHWAHVFRQRLSNMEKLLNQEITSIGPAPAPVAKISGRYRYRLTLQFKNSREIRRTLAGILCEFVKQRDKNGVSVHIDINPYE